MNTQSLFSPLSSLLSSSLLLFTLPSLYRTLLFPSLLPLPLSHLISPPLSSHPISSPFCSPLHLSLLHLFTSSLSCSLLIPYALSSLLIPYSLSSPLSSYLLSSPLSSYLLSSLPISSPLSSLPSPLRDFLPRGSGIVTRRPLVLQLINCPTGEPIRVPGGCGGRGKKTLTGVLNPLNPAFKKWAAFQ